MLSGKIQRMFEGLKLEPEALERLESSELSAEAVTTALSPFPTLGRYRKYIRFLEDITSLRALYQYRLKVVVEYFIALSETMAKYDGVYREKKIVPLPLTEGATARLRTLGPTLSMQQMAQIEAIEAKTDHDTAAITDWIKYSVDKEDIFGFRKTADAEERTKLENCLDGFHFGRTSEDVNSPAFALLNRDLFFKHLIPEIVAFQQLLIGYAQEHNLATAALTHGQPAEPTTVAKQLMNTVAAIDTILRQAFLPYGPDGKRTTLQFPVKTFGAVGNHSDLKAAYPDIDWIENDERFLAALGPGLHLDLMTTQAGLYGEYKQIYDAVCTIGRHVIKFCHDFWGWTSLQWFKKKKKAGVKGSSVMPNKYNPWRIEGAIKILEKAIVQLEYSSRALMDYPYEGDMGRSIIMRDISDDFAKFFIAFGRIREELALYQPNEEKVQQFLKANPGLAGGATQTVLKRAGVASDAYRQVQQIMINPDGTYCSQEEFTARLKADPVMSEDVKKEVLVLAEAARNTGYANQLAESTISRANETVSLIAALTKLD